MTARPIGTAGPPLPKPTRQPKARKGLKRTRPAPREKSIPRSNPKRRARQYARNFDGGCGHDDFIRGLPCAVGKNRLRRIEAAHVIPRSRGSSWRSLVPLCWDCHRAAHLDLAGMDSFGKGEGIDFAALSHALVVANPQATVPEQLAAWERLQACGPEAAGRTLDLAFLLCGFHVRPPEVAR